MAPIDRISVEYASNIEHDTFLAEFSCNGEIWGDMAFKPGAESYEQAYVLTLHLSHSSAPLVVSVAELERHLQIAKWRLTPIQIPENS